MSIQRPAPRRFWTHPNNDSVLIVEHYDSRGEEVITYDHASTKVMADTPGWHGLTDDQRERLLEGKVVYQDMPAARRIMSAGRVR